MIAAWAHALETSEIRDLANQIPGLGLVLYQRNFELAREFPAIAYTPTPTAAEAARLYPFQGFICGRDEPNVLDKYRGPSGKYLPPDHSRRQYELVTEILGDRPGWRVPACLSPTYSFWRYLFFATTFPDDYHRERGVREVAWTPTKVRKREVTRVRAEYAGPQLIAPAPYIGWNRLFMRSVAWDIRFARENPDTHVAFWSLRSAKGQEGKHGLFHRDGSMTRVGRAVRRAIRE